MPIFLDALPLLERVVEQLGVVDDHALELAVELLGLDPVGPLHLSVEPRGGRLDVDVADPAVQHVVVELGSELTAVVHLDHLDPQASLAAGPPAGVLQPRGWSTPSESSTACLSCWGGRWSPDV